jgi:hypothetical protein
MTSLALTVAPIAAFLLYVAGAWATFEKANRAGWKAIIPLYNWYVMLNIGDNAWWWLIVALVVPVVNLYALYKIHAGVARAFGKGIGYGLGLTFLGVIFFPLLGFGDAQFTKGSGRSATTGGI